MALDFPSLPYDGQIFTDPTTGSKYIYETATTKWKSIQHTGVIVAYGFDKANAAFLVANAAYDAANNVGPQIAPTYNTANAAYLKWYNEGNTPEPADPEPEPVELTPQEKLANAGLTVDELKTLLGLT